MLVKAQVSKLKTLFGRKPNKIIDRFNRAQKRKGLLLNRLAQFFRQIGIGDVPGNFVDPLTPVQGKTVSRFEQEYDGPRRDEQLGVDASHQVDAAQDVANGSDDHVAPNQRKIRIALQKRLYHLFDLRDGRHRRGLTSVMMIRSTSE